MRTIKFRGKRIDTGEWVEGDLVQNGSASTAIVSRLDLTNSGTKCLFYQVIIETVGQFTGLTDKNGKEIYEGDVLKRIDGFGKLITLVEYDYIGFIFNCKSLEANLNASLIAHSAEIIGNIHDNPDLI